MPDATAGHPSDFVDSATGDLCLLFAGHGLSGDSVHAQFRAWQHMEDDEPLLLAVSEVHFAYSPRIKWCERLDGTGCELNGEWHGHWSSCQPSPGSAYTLARELRPFTTSAGDAALPSREDRASGPVTLAAGSDARAAQCWPTRDGEFLSAT